jgi:hypothetical protein
VIDQYYPRLNITSEDFAEKNVTVTVKWNQQAGIVYRIHVRQQNAMNDREPPIPSVFTGGTFASFQLTILYNSEYIVSVDAEVIIATCTFNVTTIIRLYYGVY